MNNESSMVAVDDTTIQVLVLQGDILSKIFSFLDWKEIIRIRGVGTSWKSAANKTHIKEEVYVRDVYGFRHLANCLSQIQSIKLDQNTAIPGSFCEKQDDLSLFPRVREFKCLHDATGIRLQRFQFRSAILAWQHLRVLNLHGCEGFRWQLSDLSHLDHLQDIRCINNSLLEGDVEEILWRSCDGDTRRETSLFHSLEIFDISGCQQVTGQLKEFAKLPKLKWLGIARTGITGDLRVDVKPGDFVAVQGMGLDNDKVYGAAHIDRVSDADAVMRARHQILKQSTWDSPLYPLLVYLRSESSEYYERPEQRLYSSERDPPFSLETVLVGNRFGWRWSNYLGGFCDTHWLDPEPSRSQDENYEQELTAFLEQQQTSMFSGCMDPPAPAEYRALCRERGF